VVSWLPALHPYNLGAAMEIQRMDVETLRGLLFSNSSKICLILQGPYCLSLDMGTCLVKIGNLYLSRQVHLAGEDFYLWVHAFQ